MIDLIELWGLQLEQQRDLGLDPCQLDDVERGRVITDLVVQLHEEVSELGRMVPTYKRHLLSRPGAVSAVVAEEVADVLKTVVALAQTHELSLGEVTDAFVRKTVAVRERSLQERVRLEKATPLLCFDLDDVICDLKPWRDELCGADFDAPPADKLVVVERLKEQFYKRGRFREMEPIHGAREAMERFASQGYQLVIITARPQWQYKRLYGDTVIWLREHGIPFHRVLFNKDKVEALYEHIAPAWPRWFVEDHERNAKALSAVGVDVLLYDQPHNQGFSAPGVHRVCGWDDIADLIGVLS